MNVEDILLADQIINNVEEAGEIGIRRRLNLTRRDPFELPDDTFIKLFRLTRPLVNELVEMLTPHLEPPSRRSSLSVETKVLASLRFLGFGSYQEITGTNSFIGISQANMSRCITEVCTALNSPQILNRWIKFPQNIEEMENLRYKFYNKYRFVPGVVGCIDCNHVAICAPPENDPQHPERVYVNRKNYHSLNVQLDCDLDLKIMNVNARFPGNAHDSHIWRQSVVSQIMETVYRQNPANPLFLLGDSGYPLRPWLITPISQVGPETPEGRFDKTLCSIRSLIEQCNGLLKNRFRCLLKHRQGFTL